MYYWRKMEWLFMFQMILHKAQQEWYTNDYLQARTTEATCTIQYKGKENIWPKLWDIRIMQHKLNKNRNLGLATSGNNPSGLI